MIICCPNMIHFDVCTWRNMKNQALRDTRGFITAEAVQYFGGCHQYMWRDSISTSTAEAVQYCGG